MIRLHPVPEANHWCPYCGVGLAVSGWYIPGMRNLADLRCPQCAREFYGDLASGHGLHYPMLLEKAGGIIHDRVFVPWFAEWLRMSYMERQNKPVGFTVEEYKPVRRAVLLNCLDRLYGHCLLKLLNAQHYLDHKPDLGLIVLVPKNLRWLVPDGVASVWSVNLPLSRGTEWNDWLGQEIHRRVELLDECCLSVAFSHPHPHDFNIERFSRIKPFPIEEWEKRLQRPTITFIWRDDRLWFGAPSADVPETEKGHRLSPILEQSRSAVELASRLKKRFAKLDFAVAGLGRAGGLPDWILDLRIAAPDDIMERRLCQRYAESHVVVGVHGSSMLLPSAHAASVVELMPQERWGNVLQDLLLRRDDQRETLFRYRIIPLTVSVEVLSDVITSLLEDWTQLLLNMQREWCQHEAKAESGVWTEARKELSRMQRQRSLKFLIVNTDYHEFLRWLYARHPGLEKESYEQQMRVRNESCFGVADFYSSNLRKLGHEAWDIYANNEFMQKAWAREHDVQPNEALRLGLSHASYFQRGRRLAAKVPLRYLKPFLRPLRLLASQPVWFYQILAAQIRRYKPDVLLVQDMGAIKSSFLKEIRSYVRLLVGQIASPLPKEDFSCYDLIVSSLPNLVEHFRRIGLPAELHRLAFEPKVLNHLNDENEKIPVSFVGSLSRLHQQRIDLLESLCPMLDVKVWGPNCDGLAYPSPILRAYMGPAWGVDMYNVLRNSKITLNNHIGVAESYANNMRLFEATGVGTLLITDWKENLHEMFEPGKEVIAYHTQEECADFIEYCLTHDGQREAIARAGQQRTLREHTYYHRMQELVDIIRKQL